MSLKQLKWRLRYAAQYIPFTINTLICILAAYIAYRLLYGYVPKDEISPFRPFIILMGKIVFWFAIAVVGLSIISTFASWLYYLWLRKRKGNVLQVSFTTEVKKNGKKRMYMDALLEGVQRPVLGFVKGRLFYDDHNLTPKFSLLSNQRKPNSILRTGIKGRSRMSLPDIKEYQLKGGFIYFEDMLHLFSLAAKQPVGGQFYQPPVLADEDERDVYPRKTETMDVRIEQLRRVEGELHNYKDFEAGDDVRRIVWKMYAKNRNLVVRVPEMFEPYASHLYFYASFYAPVKAQWLSDSYFKEMLNYYKNYVWTVYDTLSKKEWEMRYMPDQSFNTPENLSEGERSARIISNSNWHTDKSLQQYFNPKTGAVLCVSSLTDPEELRNMLEQCDASIVVYYVKVSRVFRHFVAWNWLKRLVLLPPKDRLNRLRSSWTFSPIRLQMQKREKEIEAILDSSNVTHATL
jgi:hypothetical protein